MNKNQKLRWNFYLAAMAAIVVFTIVHACRKIDYRRDQPKGNYQSRFFNVPANSMPTVKRIANEMKLMNDKNPFIEKFIKRVGYPIWDKSMGYATPSAGRAQFGEVDTLVFVPFAPEGIDQVTSFLACVANEDSISIRVLNSDEYYRFEADFDESMSKLSSETVLLQTMYMDSYVYPRDSFKIIDPRLFIDGHKPYDTAKFVIVDTSDASGGGGSDGKTSSGSLMVLGLGHQCWTITMHYELCQCGKGHGRTQDPGDRPELEICIDVNMWINQVLDHPAVTMGSGGSGNPAGLLNAANCNAQVINACGLPPHHGYVPVVGSVPDPQNDPYSADSVRIDDEILDSFPCVYHLIKDTLFNVNKVVQKSMKDFFTLNMKNHVYFEINWAFDCNSQFNAYTKPNGVRSVINGVVHWTDTIQLNPCFLRNASKEKIIQVLIHEPIHAFISWCVKDYNGPNPTIDSTFLMEHFGIYWEWLKQKPYEHVEDHDLMVRNFLKYMSGIIYKHSNPNAPADLRKWVADRLAATGLHETSAWGTALGVTDTCNIYGIDYWSRRHKPGSAPSSTYLPDYGCRTYNTAFRDSLQMMRGDSCN